MAKKKDDVPEEDDWFEDFDDDEEEEDKPQKKTKKGKKDGSKAWIWVVAFFVVLAILLVVRFKYGSTGDTGPTEIEEPAPADEIEERYVPQEKTSRTGTGDEEEDSDYEESGVYEYDSEKYLGPDVVPKEDLPKVQEVIDTTVEPDLFSNLRCDYDYDSGLLYISLRVYNIFDEDFKISPRGIQKGYNTYFLIRGVVDTDPGCGTELLHPGEYTDCDRIGFDLQRYANIPGINRISVQVPGKTEALLIECPDLPEGEEVEYTGNDYY